MSRRKTAPGQPQSPLIYWVDRALGRRNVPDALAEAGVEIRRYVDLYPDEPDVADARWIPEVTERGWVILTKDAAITRNPAEIDAIRRAKARFVCLAAQSMDGPSQVDCLLKHWRTIEGVLRTRRAPVLVKVLRTEVQWHDGNGWRRVKHKKPR